MAEATFDWKLQNVSRWEIDKRASLIPGESPTNQHAPFNARVTRYLVQRRWWAEPGEEKRLKSSRGERGRGVRTLNTEGCERKRVCVCTCKKQRGPVMRSRGESLLSLYRSRWCWGLAVKCEHATLHRSQNHTLLGAPCPMTRFIRSGLWPSWNVSVVLLKTFSGAKTSSKNKKEIKTIVERKQDPRLLKTKGKPRSGEKTISYYIQIRVVLDVIWCLFQVPFGFNNSCYGRVSLITNCAYCKTRYNVQPLLGIQLLKCVKINKIKDSQTQCFQ